MTAKDPFNAGIGGVGVETGVVGEALGVGEGGAAVGDDAPSVG
jgi:hypothetical protein